MFGGSKHRSSIGTTGCSYGFGVRHQPLPRFQGSKPGWKRLLGKELRKLQLPPPRARRARSPNLASSGKNLRVFWPLMLGKFPHTLTDTVAWKQKTSTASRTQDDSYNLWIMKHIFLSRDSGFVINLHFPLFFGWGGTSNTLPTK